MSSNQLRLVEDLPAFVQTAQDPTRRVFEHWLFMTSRNPRRCKLGPVRRAAINGALALFDEQTVMIAVDGMASDPLEGCTGRMRDAMREIEWFLATEARIERWAERGDALHQQAAEQEAATARRAAQPAAPPDDPEACAAARERVRQLAQSTRGEASRHG